ncbi:hypothetical protein EJF36_10445 [Bacillus sp. HMF5848]|nr:hypothetical protein EJF36_10445 [Bacillus sp. HMF5848]
MRAVTFRGLRNVEVKEVEEHSLHHDEDIIVLISVYPTDIITHALPLENAKHGYKIFDEKLDNCIKVILKP